jgi:hypothetical protein
MNLDALTTEGLDRQVRAVVEADNPSAVFKALLEGARLAAPRAAVFLVRQDQIKGWGSIGYGGEAAQKQRAHNSPAGAGWLGRIVAEEEPASESGSIGGDLDFGQPPSSEWFGTAVRVKSRAIALLVAERGADEQPWAPPLLQLMVRVAQLRLDLDLLRRKLRGSAPEPRQAAEEEAAAEAPAKDAASAGELSPAPEKPSRSPEDEKQLEAARRYARLVATDIRLYNEEAVMLGRRHGDLVQRLGDHLGRGKETFLRRHGSLGPAGLEILHDAYVQVLAAGDGQLMPSSVLD